MTTNTDELEIIETPPPAEQEGTPPKAPATVLADEDEDHEEGDARGHEDPAATDEEREAIRARRRQEKEDRKARKDAAIRHAARERAELAELRRQNQELLRRTAALEQHTAQSSLAGVDSAIAQAQNEFQMARDVVAKAIAAGNGDDATTAMDFRDRAAEKLRELTALKARATQQPPQRQQAAPAGPDPTVVKMAAAFVNENKSWYDPNGGNEDSAIVRAIDEQVLRDGYDPSTEEYWSELRKRVARRLPERAATTPQREPRGGPALASGRGEGSGNPRQFYLSPERKKAMQDAGMWDDPVKRQKAAQAYKEYDKNNRK
jgi:hypothetical protein